MPTASKSKTAAIEMPMGPDGRHIFSGKSARFINAFTELEDLELACKRAGITYTEGQKMFKRRSVFNEIERRLDILQAAQLNLIARHRHKVSVPLVDDMLVTAMQKGSRRGDVAALKLGYQRLGMIRADEFVGVQNQNSGEAPKPMIFTREIAHTTTVTTTERAELPEGMPQPPRFEPGPATLLAPPPKVTILKY